LKSPYAIPWLILVASLIRGHAFEPPPIFNVDLVYIFPIISGANKSLEELVLNAMLEVSLTVFTTIPIL